MVLVQRLSIETPGRHYCYGKLCSPTHKRIQFASFSIQCWFQCCLDHQQLRRRQWCVLNRVTFNIIIINRHVEVYCNCNCNFCNISTGSPLSKLIFSGALRAHTYKYTQNKNSSYLLILHNIATYTKQLTTYIKYSTKAKIQQNKTIKSKIKVRIFKQRQCCGPSNTQ